jgi:hypothetical protein
MHFFGEKTPQITPKASQTPPPTGRHWLVRLVLVLFVLQLGWLVWQLRGDIGDMARRGWFHTWGPAVRQEDPFYRWVAELDRDIPPGVTYLFLDNYEAGKEVEARYHLFPREHLLLLPESSPSLLFYTLRQNHVTYIFVRDAKLPPGPGLQAVLDLGAAQLLNLPGPGLVYRVDPKLIKGGFYD